MVLVPLELTLFGPPRVRRDGEPVAFDTRKALALLAYLAVTARPHGRDALAALLWPELERAKARATLRRTLSVATAVGPALCVSGDAIGLDAAQLVCDVTEFRRLAAEGTAAAARRAVELAADRFLEGFALRDSPEFEDWRFTVAGSLRDELSVTLRRLSATAVRAGDFAAALRYARRRTVVDPLSEPAHADLMRVTAWSGDRPGAMQAYRELVRLLDRGLGVAPLPETMALYEAIRTGAMPPPPSDAAAAPSTAAAVGPSAPSDDSATVERLAEDVERRLAAAAEVTRQVVEAAAIIGEAADADLLRAVAGRAEDEVAAALGEAVARRLLVRRDAPTVYAPAHALVAAALARLPLARHRLLHGRAAEALARRHGTDPIGIAPETIGRHFAEAGRDAQAADWFAAAADAASARSAHAEALEAARSALALGRDTAAVHAAIGAALVRLARYDEALVALEQAAGLAAGEPGRLAEIEHAIAGVQDRLGEWALAEARLEAALALALDGPPERHARILADLALVRHRRGDAAAGATAAAAARSAAAAGDDAALTQADNVLGVLAAAVGDHRAARRRLLGAVERARGLGDEDLLIAALNNLSRAELGAGDAEAALAAAREALDLAERRGDRHRLAALHSNVADLLHAAGRDEEAIAELKSSAAAFAEVFGAAARPEVWTLTEW